MIKNSIFIPIAACEERFIELTVRSALLKAKNPSNIFFGIFNNIIDKSHSLLENDFITNNNQILYTEIVSPAPMGIGFARMNASLLQFYDFEYMFQIDSHTIFTQNWDEQLINNFNKIKNQEGIDENKLILSAIPAISWAYDEDNLNQTYILDKKNQYEFNKIYFSLDNFESEISTYIQQGLSIPSIRYDGAQGSLIDPAHIGFPITYGDGFVENDYTEINCIHATFMFSKAKLNRDVLHDPGDLFNGDQTNYGIRLLSRGYRIFCPKYPVIAVLDKYIVLKDKNGYYPVDRDEKHNWRTYEKYDKKTLEKNGKEYQNYQRSDDFDFFYKMINGEYFGYWGTPDKESLDKVKKIIDYPEHL